MKVYICPRDHVCSVVRPNSGNPKCFFCGAAVREAEVEEKS